MSPYASLMSPVSIGAVQVRNRVISSSHQTGLVHDHLPTDVRAIGADLFAFTPVFEWIGSRLSIID